MLRRLRWVIESRSGWILTVVFALSLATVAWYTLRQNQFLVEASAMDSARLYTEALAEFRSLYTSEVVDRLRDTDIEVVHDYDVRSGSVPLPATLTILLGQRIGEGFEQASVRLYSPYPFPWREATGGLRDDFAREAWAALSGQGLEVFQRFEEDEDGAYLRYATADRMETACVTCHNSHTATPRADWRVGDVRGVLEVRYPLDQVLAVQGTGRRNSLILLVTVFTLGGFGISTVVYAFGHRRELLDRLVERRTRDLAVSERRIRSVVESIVEAVILIKHDGRIQSVNAAAEQMFGYTESELVGENVSILMPSPYREEHDGYLRNYFETGTARIIGVGGRRLKGLRRNGEIFDIELAVSESSTGSERLFVGVIRDISVQLEYERELEQLSTRDELTGLGNRRAMVGALSEEWRRCLRSESPISVMLVDVDYFKQFNDYYGHLAGDECLKRVAQVMADGVHRPGDLVARFGGEEFILVLPGADGATAEAMAEKIRRAVLDLHIPHANHVSSEFVTVSAGVASRIPSGDATSEALVHNADTALYRAKGSGRNQVQNASADL